MSGQRREVEVELITDEKRQTVSDQALSQNVDDRMRHVLRAGIQMEHRQNLGAGIDDQPKPQNLLGAAQPGTQLVQLQVREMKMAEDVLVQGVRVPGCSSESSRHRGLLKAKDPFCGGRSNLSTRAESTTATCCEGVFRRYKEVLRRALNVVRHA